MTSTPARSRDTKGQLGATERQIAENRALATQAAEHAAVAKERIGRLERGEDVPGGLSRQPDIVELLLNAGMTRADLRRAVAIAKLGRANFEDMMHEIHERMERAHNAAVRAFLRRYACDRSTGSPTDS
jgi:hypothetical protein